MSERSGKNRLVTERDPMPRKPPGHVLMMLGSYAAEPGFAKYLIDAQDFGFGLAQPGDHDLDDERWAEVSDLRVRALIASYKRSREGVCDV